MLYMLGKNYEAEADELAELILTGEMFPIPACDMDKQTFLTIYRVGHAIGNGAFLAFTGTQLRDIFSPYTDVKQYLNFLYMDQRQMRDLCTAVIAAEPVEGEEEEAGFGEEEDPVEAASR